MKVLLLCVLLWLPSAAWAIPTAGTYVLLTDANISGSFTSTGTSLSAWDLHSDLFDRVFLGVPDPAVVSWRQDTDHWTLINDAAMFSSLHAVHLETADQSGHWGGFLWSPDPSILTASWRVDALCCDARYDAPPVVSFALVEHGRLAVPEPDSVFLLSLAFLGLVGLGAWTRRRQCS